MIILPAIDIINGSCVRLAQGDYSRATEYDADPVEVAQRFCAAGAGMVHVIDLDGARAGRPVNAETVLRVARSIPRPVQTGGGIRTYEDAAYLLERGVRRVILGTAALERIALVGDLVRDFGPDRVAVSVDIKHGEIATNGWERTHAVAPEEVLARLKAVGVSTVIMTDVVRDGMLAGPNVSFAEIAARDLSLIVAGGVSSLDDLAALSASGASGAVVGKALYEGKVDLAEAVRRFAPPSRLAKRVIPCMDVRDGMVVKGVNFKDLKDVGDPVELGERYSKVGADELVFLDVTATIEGRHAFADVVARVAERVSIPFAVGGGIRDIETVRTMLGAGADKVSLGSVAVRRPDFVNEAADRFGAQCIMISVDAKRKADGEGWEIYIDGGRTATGIDAVAFAADMERRGAGELLVNSLDRDGRGGGYDLPLLTAMTRIVNLPVVASSGAGAPEHFLAAFTEAKVDAVLAAGVFHRGELSIEELKRYLRENGISMRQ